MEYPLFGAALALGAALFFAARESRNHHTEMNAMRAELEYLKKRAEPRYLLRGLDAIAFHMGTSTSYASRRLTCSDWQADKVHGVYSMTHEQAELARNWIVANPPRRRFKNTTGGITL